MSRTQCQVSWLTFVTVATFNTVRFTSSLLASIATTHQPIKNHGPAADSVKSKGPEAEAGKRYNLQTHKCERVKDGKVTKIRSLNSQDLSALQTTTEDDTILTVEDSYHLIRSQIDCLRQAIREVAEHPRLKDCEDHLTANVATLQDHLRKWEAARYWWYNERGKPPQSGCQSQFCCGLAGFTGCLALLAIVDVGRRPGTVTRSPIKLTSVRTPKLLSTTAVVASSEGNPSHPDGSLEEMFHESLRRIERERPDLRETAIYTAARGRLDQLSKPLSGAQEENRARVFAQTVKFVLLLDEWIPPRRSVWTAPEREAFDKAIELRLGPIKTPSLAHVTLRRVAALAVLYWLLSKFGYV
ncbi:MAG: hypothetical protein Q9184_003029 [Pyrenodesmia sp. 2 TL-2023]